jgi:hypothetical protein
MRRLLVAASIVPGSSILVTRMKEVLSSFEASVLTRVTWRNIPEDAILHEQSLILQVAGDEQPFAGPRPYGRSISQVQTTIRGQSPSNTCRVHHKSLPDLHTSPAKTNGTSSNERYCELCLEFICFKTKTLLEMDMQNTWKLLSSGIWCHVIW